MSFISSLKVIARQIFYTPKLSVQSLSYDEYWKVKRGEGFGILNEYQRKRVEWISSRLEPGDIVLDVGCGDGVVILELQKKISVKTIGADISDLALSYLDKKGIEVIKCDLTDLSSIDDLPVVDHILLLEVLEHMPQPEEFLLKIKKKARKSVVFSFPNTGFISYRLRLLFGRFPVQWRINPGEHLRFWTYNDLKWWLQELGLKKNAEISTYEGLPFFNKLFPSIFAAALISQIRFDKNENGPEV